MACPTCGLVQLSPPVPEEHRAKCARCGFAIYHRRAKSQGRTAALALAAAVLFVPANLYPIVETTYFGSERETTIFDGVRHLWSLGSYFVSSLVFLTSILTPALKIAGLLFLSLTANGVRLRRLKTWIYKTIEFVDPWNMLEVYLLAIMVVLYELSFIARIDVGPGVVSFAAVVVLTILATITFDPRLVWDEPKEPA